MSDELKSRPSQPPTTAQGVTRKKRHDPWGAALRARWPLSLRERFDAKWTPEPNTGCWLWTARVDRYGYGKFRFADRMQGAHRVAWELVNGPIPQGMVLDHRCRTRSCVNPEHLRVVDAATNVMENSRGLAAQNAQKTVCPLGHPLSGDNLIVQQYRNRPHRNCRICVNNRHQKRRHQIQGAGR